MNRLYRSETDRMVGGVCGGLAASMGWDPTTVRLGWALLTLFWGAGLIFYLIAWIVIPKQSSQP
ncbi:MAG: PspC domain-containing protein [Thermaerobacterales bacterium]